MKLLGFILILALFSEFAVAIPIPQGVSGTIYGLDGITQVPNGVEFSVNNTVNEYFISSRTGRGPNSGKYALSILGDFGDEVIIKSWNIEHNSTTTITLDGVMRNIDLLLNMSLKPYAPVFTSQPNEMAIEDTAYKYQAMAIDHNYQRVYYALADGPQGMQVDWESGLVLWVPTNEHVGVNQIIIQATDLNLSTNQTFNVHVTNVNDAPNITSLPITKTFTQTPYKYQVTAEDEDEDTLQFELNISPPGMKISKNLIHWTPKKDDTGNHTVLVTVSDGIAIASQLYILEVLEKKSSGSGPPEKSLNAASRGSRGGNVLPTSTGRLVVSDGNNPLKLITFEMTSLAINPYVSTKLLNSRPEGVAQPPSRVYKYMEIKEGNFDENALKSVIIKFSVATNWMIENEIQPENVVLKHYKKSKWEELNTTLIDVEENEAIYEAYSKSLSLFAISVKNEILLDKINSKQPEPRNAIKQVYSIEGKIIGTKMPIEYVVTNLRTNISVGGITSDQPVAGIFAAIIEARIDDLIAIRAKDYNDEIIFEITGDMAGIELILTDKKNFMGITGRITEIGEAEYVSFGFVLITLGILVYGGYLLQRKNGKK